MKKTKLFLTDTEDMIMEYMWSMKRPILSAEISEFLIRNYDRDLTAQTINTHLRRMDAKGFVRRVGKKSGAICYEAVISEFGYVKRLMDYCRDAHCGGSAYTLALNLFAGQPLSPEEKKMLIQELEK